MTATRPSSSLPDDVKQTLGHNEFTDAFRAQVQIEDRVITAQFKGMRHGVVLGATFVVACMLFAKVRCLHTTVANTDATQQQYRYTRLS